MKIKVGAYCRVSTEKDDQVNSLENQRRYFNTYIKNNNEWEFVDIYADEGISGTQVKNRIEFQRMIEDAQNKKLDLILTKEISRFARNTLDSIKYTRMLKKLGVGIIFINDNINTLDGDGELRLTIMAGIAQDESRKTSERVKWGQKRMMEQGVVFGRELLGYKLKRGILTIDEEEAEIVRLIFYKYTVEGKGTHVIARELYDQGIKSKKQNNKWTNTVILKILRNEKYVGDLLQKKTITPDYLDHKKKYNSGEEEFIYIKDHHEQIIDRELWDRTQIELKKRSCSKEQGSKHSNKYWCSGKLICSECGKKFVCKRKKINNGTYYTAWICNQAKNYGKRKIDKLGNEVGCNNCSINHIVLERAVNYVLQSIDYDKDTVIAELVSEIKKIKLNEDTKSLEPLIRKINSITNKKQSIIELKLDGKISTEDMVLMNTKYEAEILKIKNQIRNINETSQLNKNLKQNSQILFDKINSILNEKECINKNAVYSRLVDKIIIHKDKTLDMYLSFSPTFIRVHYSTKGRREDYVAEFEITGAINSSKV